MIIKRISRTPRIETLSLFAAAAGFASLFGCSLVLDLDERTCVSPDECSVDGSSVCTQGVCEPASTDDGTTAGTSTSTTGSSLSVGRDTETFGGTTTAATDATLDDTGSAGSSESGAESSISMESSGSGETGCAEAACATSEGEESESETGRPPIPDLILNGGFEDSTNDWIPRGGGEGVTIEATTEQMYGGAQSVVVTERSADWHGIAQRVTDRVVEEVVYSLSAFVRVGHDAAATAAVAATLQRTCIDDVEAGFFRIGSVAATTDAWTEITGTFTIPPGCDAIEVLVYFEQGVYDSGSEDPIYLDFYVDDVVVTGTWP